MDSKTACLKQPCACPTPTNKLTLKSETLPTGLCVSPQPQPLHLLSPLPVQVSQISAALPGFHVGLCPSAPRVFPGYLLYQRNKSSQSTGMSHAMSGKSLH